MQLRFYDVMSETTKQKLSYKINLELLYPCGFNKIPSCCGQLICQVKVGLSVGHTLINAL